MWVSTSRNCHLKTSNDITERVHHYLVIHQTLITFWKKFNLPRISSSPKLIWRIFFPIQLIPVIQLISKGTWPNISLFPIFILFLERLLPKCVPREKKFISRRNMTRGTFAQGTLWEIVKIYWFGSGGGGTQATDQMRAVSGIGANPLWNSYSFHFINFSFSWSDSPRPRLTWTIRIGRKCEKNRNINR